MARGRKSLLSNKFAIVNILESGDLGGISDWYRIQLMERGLIEQFNMSNEGKRGRPRVAFKVTGKGRSYLALSKSWKRNQETMSA